MTPKSPAPALPYVGLRMADTGDWWIQILEIESDCEGMVYSRSWGQRTPIETILREAGQDLEDRQKAIAAQIAALEAYAAAELTQQKKEG